MQIRLIKTLSELEDIRSYWQSMQCHPNSDFEHFQLVCRNRTEVKPHVIVVEKNSRPQTILVGRFENTHIPLSLGYLNVYRIPAKLLIIIYQGLLGEAGEGIAEELVNYLREILRRGEADALVCSHIDENSQLLNAFVDGIPKAWQEKKLLTAPHWEMEVPLEVEVILKRLKSNHRRHIIGREKKLNSTFPDTLIWRWIDRFEDIPRLCAQLELVAKKTYHRGLGAGFINNEEYIQRFECFSRRGLLRMQLLQIENNIKAFWIGSVYNGVFYASETAYDPELRDFEVGTLGLLKTAENLAREDVRKIDFGFGDAAYKKRFGSKCWQEKTLRIFSPNRRGVALKCLLRGGAVLESLARGVVGKGGFVNRLKTAWRRRLESARSKNKINE